MKLKEKIRHWFLSLIGALFAMALAACGSDGSDGKDGADGEPGVDSLVITTDEPAGTNCAEGGIRIDVGRDDNGNGVLDPDEVDETRYICDGEPAGPVISGISTIGSPIYPGGQVQVYVSASSPSGEPLSYSWEIPEGWDGSDSGAEVLVLTAPDQQAAQGRVSVAVSDGERSRSAFVELATRGPEIETWSADLSAAEPLAAGATIELSVTAYNRDGMPLIYHHDIGGLRFEAQTTDWQWTVTQRAMGGRYRVQSIVEDGAGLSAHAGTDVAIEGVSAWPAFGGNRQRTGRSPSPEAHGAVGNEIWNSGTVISGPVRSSPALGADGTVYVASDDYHVYALDPEDGSEKWSFLTDTVLGSLQSSPAVGADGTVYVGSWDNKVYALAPEDGSEKWSFLTGNVVASSPALGADGTVYVGSQDGNVYALEPADGSEKWSFRAGNSVYSSPALGADGTVYVGSQDGNVYALDPADGSEIWSFPTTGRVSSSPALGDDGTVYVSTEGDYRVYALNPDGSRKWTFRTGDNVRSSPAVGADGTVYVGSGDKKVYALDPDDGSVKWSFLTENSVLSSPAVGADGTVYVGSNDRSVYALDPADGSKKWAFPTGGAVQGSPALGADGTVYVGSNDGKVYAIR